METNMKLIQILFSVASGFGIVKDFIATKDIKKENKMLYYNIKRSERELIDLFNEKISNEVEKIYSEINSLKIVLRFLALALVIILIVLAIIIILFLFILKKNMG